MITAGIVAYISVGVVVWRFAGYVVAEHYSGHHISWPSAALGALIGLFLAAIWPLLVIIWVFKQEPLIVKARREGRKDGNSGTPGGTGY